MTTELFLTLLIEMAALAYYYRYHEANIGTIADINILMIALFSAKLANFGPGITNVGCIWYSAAMASQALLCETQGAQTTWRTVGAVLRTLTIFMLLIICLDAIPGVAGDNSEIEAAIDTISPHSLTAVAATYLAFCAGQMVLICLMGAMKGGPRYVRITVAMIFAQIVDSVVFFPVAFGKMPLRDVGHIAVSGVAVKSALAVIFAGVIIACIRWIKPVSP